MLEAQATLRYFIFSAGDEHSYDGRRYANRNDEFVWHISDLLPTASHALGMFAILHLQFENALYEGFVISFAAGRYSSQVCRQTPKPLLPI